MANFFTDTKNKIQDLFVYLVSCGNYSKEPSGIYDQEQARDAPLEDDLGLKLYIPEEEDQDAGVPPINNNNNNTQGQGPIIVLQPGNVTQNQGQPTISIPQVEDNQQRQEQIQGESKNDDDFEPLPVGFIPEKRANFSTPPGRRSAPDPKTG